MRRLGFDFDKETVPIAEFTFTSKMQVSKAVAAGAIRMWRYRFILYPYQIPKYVMEIINDRGYDVVRVGSKTYQYSIWALVPKKG